MSEFLKDSVGRRLRLLQPIGKGGFGAVFLAEVHTPGGLVQRMAVKVLHADLMRDTDLVARARDEARLMSQLNHDHIIKVHALTQLGSRSAVLMEFVEGVDCHALLEEAHRQGQAGLPITVATAIIERSASALHAAWTSISPQTGQPLRVVHRDIKPSNVLVSVGGVVKVMDFGVARADFEREAKTSSVQFGTQRYMAPERWLDGTAGPESDLFSLGVTYWELLTGQRCARFPLGQDAYNAHVQKLLDRVPDPGVRELLGDMLRFEHALRPTAAQVEDRAGAALERLTGPDLRRWSRGTIPELVEERLHQLRQDAEVRELTGTLARAQGSHGATVQPLGKQPTRITPRPSGDEPAPVRRDRSKLGILAGVLIGVAAVGISALGAWQVLQAGLENPNPAELVEVEDDVAPAAVVVVEPSDETSEPEPEPEPESEPKPEETKPGRDETTQPPKGPKPATRSPQTDGKDDPASGTGAPASVVEEPEPEPVVAQVVPEPEPEPEPVWVPIKITADPMGGSAAWGGTSTPFMQSVDVPVGQQTFVYTWPEGPSVRCSVRVSEGMRGVHFDQKLEQCKVKG